MLNKLKEALYKYVFRENYLERELRRVKSAWRTNYWKLARMEEEAVGECCVNCVFPTSYSDLQKKVTRQERHIKELTFKIMEKKDKNKKKVKDVHTEHCCTHCGCKYSDDYCTVENLKKKQTYQCGMLEVCGNY